MRQIRPNYALVLVGTLVTVLHGCQQSDQLLPFELDATQGQTLSVTSTGGIVSVPPGFSIEFFPGSLTGAQTVTAQQRLDAFPPDGGLVVPGTAYDVGPTGVTISPSAPARVQIAVPAALLGAGDELSLSVALLRSDNSIVTDATSYDLSNGILTADVYELGPVAAVVASDAILIGDIADVPTLDGGAITPVSPPPSAAARAPSRPGGVEFSASCSPGERSCLRSGIAKVWVDDVVRERLGSDLVLLNTTVEASIEFFAFNLSALPDSVVGYLRIDGDLRARINSVVASREVGEEVAFYTGNGSDPDNPDPTALFINGGELTFEFTSEDDPEVIGFDITGVGTSDLLTILVVGEILFENASGPPTIGTMAVQVRLRR